MSQSKEKLYGASSALQLGYANIAILLGLLEKLVQRGAISGPDATELVRSAMDDMSTHGSGTGVADAIRLIKESVLPQMAK